MLLNDSIAEILWMELGMRLVFLGPARLGLFARGYPSWRDTTTWYLGRTSSRYMRFDSDGGETVVHANMSV